MDFERNYGELFKNHKATRLMKENLEKIIWSQGNCFYYMEYLFDGRRMIISGDCGIAVFEFTEIVNAEKVVGYKDWDYYVMSKFKCSDFDKEVLNEEKFKKDLKEWVENTSRYLEGKTIQTCFNENNYELRHYRHAITEQMLEGELDRDDDEIYNFGVMKNFQFDLLFEGLKMAVEQLKNVS